MKHCRCLNTDYIYKYNILTGNKPDKGYNYEVFTNISIFPATFTKNDFNHYFIDVQTERKLKIEKLNYLKI